MPLYTEHLNLAKPTRDERYNIAVPNGNMDVIDETIQALREENRVLREALAEKVDKEILTGICNQRYELLAGKSLTLLLIEDCSYLLTTCHNLPSGRLALVLFGGNANQINTGQRATAYPLIEGIGADISYEILDESGKYNHFVITNLHPSYRNFVNILTLTGSPPVVVNTLNKEI